VPTLNLDIKYAEIPVKIEEAAGGITEFIVNSAAGAAHPHGMDRDVSKIFGRIQIKLSTSNGFVDLDDTELGWILDTVEGAKLPSLLSAWKWTLVDELKKAKG